MSACNWSSSACGIRNIAKRTRRVHQKRSIHTTNPRPDWNLRWKTMLSTITPIQNRWTTHPTAAIQLLLITLMSTSKCFCNNLEQPQALHSTIQSFGHPTSKSRLNLTRDFSNRWKRSMVNRLALRERRKQRLTMFHWPPWPIQDVGAQLVDFSPDLLYVLAKKKSHRDDTSKTISAEQPQANFDDIFPNSTVADTNMPVLKNAPETNELVRKMSDNLQWFDLCV